MTGTLQAFASDLKELLLELDYYKAKVDELEAKPADNRPKLSDQDVKDIRSAYRGGMPQIDIANNYGVNPSTISRIVRGFYH